MYIVTGATGQTGSVVAKTLLEKGLPVRVIVRSEEKGKSWKVLGAEVAVADVSDSDALTRAFEGGKVLYLMNPPDYQSEDLLVEAEKFINATQTAIENSSLEKLVVLSSVGGHLSSGTGVIYNLHLIEQAFGKLDIPVTFLRPPSFMENWNSVLEAANNEGVLPSFYDPLDMKFPQISTDDIGHAAVEAMLEKTEGVQIRELAGIEYSTNDVAEAFSKVLGKPITAVPIPEDQWLGILQTFCSPRNAELIVGLYKGINSGTIPFETDSQIKSSVTIDEYAAKALTKSAAQGSN